MPILAAMIDRALSSGRLVAIEDDGSYHLMARFCGMLVGVATITKAEVAESRRPKLVPVE